MSKDYIFLLAIFGLPLLALVISWRSALPILLGMFGLVALFIGVSGGEMPALVFGAVCLLISLWVIPRVRAKIDRWQELEFADDLRTASAANQSALLDTDVRGQRLTIDHQKLVFGKRTMPTGHVTKVTFDNSTLYVNGFGNFTKTVSVSDGKREIAVPCAGLTGNRRSELLYESVSQAVWSAICVPMLRKWITAISSGHEVSVGKVRLSRDGLIVQRMLGQDRFCPWAGLTCRVENGTMELGQRGKTLSRMKLNGRANAVLLHAFVRSMIDGHNETETARW